jgi:hypothetical protein
MRIRCLVRMGRGPPPASGPPSAPNSWRPCVGLGKHADRGPPARRARANGRRSIGPRRGSGRASAPGHPIMHKGLAAACGAAEGRPMSAYRSNSYL